MFQVIAGVGLALHGLIHLIGFVVPWRLATLEGFPYRTSALGGALALGDGGTRLLGVVWLAIAVGFIVAAAGAIRSAPWAGPAAVLMAVASTVVCVLGLPESVAGIVVNVAIAGVVTYRAVGHPAATETVR